MQLRLRVIKGPNQGAVFIATGQGCVLVGRDAPGSRAQFRLGLQDPYVSRNHFLLELQPPNCYLRDNGSRNGTSLKTVGDREFHRVSICPIAAGALVQAGDTILRLSLANDDSPEERVSCTECGKDVSDALAPGRAENRSYLDYLCFACRDRYRSSAENAVLAGGSFLCAACGRDVTRTANRDGRALELQAMVSYLCDMCATSAQDHRGVVQAQEVRDYLVLEEIGRGSLGVVHRAWHGPTGRVVALKRILPEAAMDEKAGRMFQREMAVMRTVRHPAIVRLLDHGMFDGEPFLVSEYVPDGSAERLMKETVNGPLPVPLACSLVREVLEGAGFAHDRGFIHRDIKPKNILLKRTRGGSLSAKISDFGLAKSHADAGQSCITRAGESAGTVFFMAPEQITDYRFVKPPADLYSIGVCLYYLLTYRFPFDVPSQGEQLHRLLKGQRYRDPLLVVLEDKPIPVRDRLPDLPGPLAQVVDRAVRKAACRRFTCASDFLAALDAATAQLPTSTSCGRRCAGRTGTG